MATTQRFQRVTDLHDTPLEQLGGGTRATPPNFVTGLCPICRGRST
jgi:hypothetical protein